MTGKRCPYLKLSLIERKIQVHQSVRKYSFQFLTSKDRPQSHLQLNHPYLRLQQLGRNLTKLYLTCVYVLTISGHILLTFLPVKSSNFCFVLCNFSFRQKLCGSPMLRVMFHISSSWIKDQTWASVGAGGDLAQLVMLLPNQIFNLAQIQRDIK